MSTKINSRLPSPPLTPNQKCVELDEKPLFCSHEELEKFYILFNFQDDEAMLEKASYHHTLKNQFESWIEEGIPDQGQFIPFPYVIEKMHRIGSKLINKKTRDARPLRVYEIGKDRYEDYWVHPIYLSLQSFQFYKLFEDVRSGREQGPIEIEVPSLPAFPFILYYLYTGDHSKLLEIAKSNDSICRGIIETINTLEIDTSIV